MSSIGCACNSPVDPTVLVSDDQSPKGAQPGGFELCQHVLVPELFPGFSGNCTLLSVWCGLGSSTRAQGGAGLSLNGTHVHGQPLLCQGWRGNESLGQPSPMWGPEAVPPWPGLLSSLSSSRTAQVGTGLVDTGWAPNHSFCPQ